MRSIVRVVGGPLPSFSSSQAIASAPICDQGFATSRSRTSSTWASTATGVRFATVRAARDRSLAQSGSVGS